MTPQPNAQEHSLDLQKLFSEFLSDEAIERTKEDLDTSATTQILVIATILRELQSSTDQHANDLWSDGFELRAEEAKQRAAEYERAYLSICRIWPTEIIELLFEDEDKELASLRAELEQVKAEAKSFGEQFARLKVERQNLKDAVGEISAELLADDPFDQLGARLAMIAKGETTDS